MLESGRSYWLRGGRGWMVPTGDGEVLNGKNVCHFKTVMLECFALVGECVKVGHVAVLEWTMVCSRAQVRMPKWQNWQAWNRNPS
jgi:hypothetical protein